MTAMDDKPASSAVYATAITTKGTAVGFGCFLLSLSIACVLMGVYGLGFDRNLQWALLVAGFFGLGLYTLIRGVIEILKSK